MYVYMCACVFALSYLGAGIWEKFKLITFEISLSLPRTVLENDDFGKNGAANEFALKNEIFGFSFLLSPVHEASDNDDDDSDDDEREVENKLDVVTGVVVVVVFVVAGSDPNNFLITNA